MGRLLLFCLSIVWGLFSFANDEYDYDPGSSSYSIDSTSLSPMSVDTLYSTINSLKSPSIENLLPELKKKDPSLFSNYILMYGSRSLQGSSFQNPRALLVSQHAELIMTFNGESSQKGFRELEIMFFDKKSNKFNFQEISFRDGEVSYSQLNPAKCLACHQSPYRKDVDPRPNWEPYNVWPGAYNSVSHISQVTDKKYVPSPIYNSDGTYDEIYKPGERYNPFLASQLAQEETQAALFFSSTQPTHTRYQYLQPYEVFTWPGMPNYFSGGSGLKTPNNMPVRLTQSLAVLNARRLGRMIKDKYPEIFERYKYALLAAAQCSEMPLPDNLMAWHKEKLESLGLSQDEILQKKSFNRLELGIDFIFKAYGIDTADWSMDFNTSGKLAMTHKYGTPGGTSVMNDAFAGGLQEVWQVPEFINDKNCEKLKQKSLSVLTEAVHTQYTDLTEVKSPLLNRCIECHVTYALAPYIPFDDPQALKLALRENDSALYKKIQYRLGPFPAFRDAMPPQGYVTEKQKQTVLDYIEQLY